MAENLISFTLRLDPLLDHAVELYAARYRMSKQQAIRTLLERTMEAEGTLQEAYLLKQKSEKKED